MAKSPIKIPAGKSNENFVLLTESKYTNVITGGQLTLSIEDAKGLYALTSPYDTEDKSLREDVCRTMLRDLSEQILFTGGKATSFTDLATKFRAPVPEIVDPLDQPIPERVQNVVEKM